MNTLFKDDAGNLSIMRVLAVMVVFFVMLNWTIANVKAPAGTMIPLNWEELAAVAAAVIAKMGQKAIENKVIK